MAHDHTQSANSHSNQRRVTVALILTAGFMLVEVAGGLLSGSLALLADAGHMLTDTLALALALAAFRVSEKPADNLRSYGYHRLQVLAAFLNGITLLAIVLWIVYEAVTRFLQPVEVLGPTMLVVAALGLLVNIIVFRILHGGDKDNLNIRGATLHVLGDLLGSVAAIVAAIVIIFSGWTPIDPILSVLVALLILRSAWDLVRRSAHVLLEGSPEEIDRDALQADLIEQIDGIAGVHHVHLWGLTPQKLVITLHVVLSSHQVDPLGVIKSVKARLLGKYHIAHSTVEIELDECADKEHAAGVMRKRAARHAQH